MVVVWKALVVLRHIPPLVPPNRQVSPFTAAAPFILPIFIIRTMHGPRLEGKL